MIAGEVHDTKTPSLDQAKPVRSDAEILSGLLFLSQHPNEWHVWTRHLSYNAATVSAYRNRNKPHKRMVPYEKHLHWKADQIKGEAVVMVFWKP